MDFLVIAGLIAVLGFLLYYYGTLNHGYWEKRGVPFEPPLPFIGNLLDVLLLRKNQGQVIEKIYNKHVGKPVVGIFQFGSPALLVRDPQLVNQVLVTDFNSFPHNELDIDENIDPVMAGNLFCMRGNSWKRRRQMLSPAFTVGKVKSSFDKILSCADKLANFIENNPGEQQAKDLMARFTSEVVAGWGLGIDGHSFASQDPILIRLGKACFNPSIGNAAIGILTFLCPLAHRIIRKPFIPHEVPNFFKTVISDIVKHRQKTGESQPDYLQHFIDAQKKYSERNDEYEVTDDDMLAGVISFFVEGYETSSMVGSFLLYHLAMNPSIQEELRKEVSQPATLSYDAVADMPFLEQCFKEVNRLHAAIGNLSKSCATACTVGGARVEPGVTMIIPLLALHWDSNYYDNADKFDPARWGDDRKDTIPKGAYIPFGDGPRICIGYRLANIGVKTAIARIVRDFAIVPSPRTPKKFQQNPLHFMSSQKGGLYLQFKKLPKLS